MKRLLVAAVIGWVLVRGSAVLVMANQPHQSTSTPQGQLPQYVANLVAKIAAAGGDPNPSSVKFVTTTRQAAMDLIHGGRVGSNQPVYFVVLHGHFVDTVARVPPGSPFPSGHVITLTIDTATDPTVPGYLDYTIGDEVPDLTSLGPVHVLQLR